MVSFKATKVYLSTLCTVVVSGLWVGFPLGSSSVAQVRSFQDWCEDSRISPSQKHTVSVLLQMAETSDCGEAQQVLGEFISLDLVNREIEDIAPLSSLTHLKGLNLSFNQIRDITPLGNLSQLSFLLLSGNKIEDITPLGNLSQLSYVILDRNQIRNLPPSFPNLRQLTALDLQNNPLVEKKCPVTPATVCLFSDDALDVFAQGEQAYQQGNFEEALTRFAQAREVYQESGDRRKEADSLNRMGDIYSQLSEYAKSITIRLQALTLRRSLQDLPGIGASLTSLADSYEKLGQYSQARSALQAALENMEAQEQGGIPLEGGLYELPKDQGELHNSLARVQNKMGEHEVALQSAQTALKYYNLLPDGYDGKDFGIRNTFDQIGITYGYLEQFQQAESFLNQALELGEQMGDRAGIASSLTHLGQVASAQGDTQTALDSYRQALEIRKEIGDRAGSGIILNQIGAVYLSQDDYSRAIPPLQEAITLWESLRPGLRDSDKVSLFETQITTYEQLQQALIAEEQTEAALEIAERARARAFVELLAARLSGQSAETFDTPNPPTLAEIRRIAQEQQATLVQYSIVGETLYIWVIQPNGLIELRSQNLEDLGITLEDAAERTRVAAVTGRSRGVQQGVNDWVQATRSGVQDNELEPPANTQKRSVNRRLRKSYELLIEPIVDLLPNNPQETVIFIPQGSLFLVPFPALQDQQGVYLIEKHTLLTAPSIQVLGLARQRTQQLSSNLTGALVVGNPKMPSLAESPEGKPEPLDPLPGAEAEALVIADLLGTEPLIGAEATEENIAQQIENAPLIHLATHGLLDELEVLGFRTPGALALTPTGNTRATDGWLTSEEILDLNLTAQLVVLSACNTGRGDITGDGIIGLSRSLIAAGTPSVLVSLWAVPDAPTSELMQAFYRELPTSNNRAAALRQAMLTTLETFPNPKAWAGFTLVGEGRVMND
ncbi:CHAT domain-containing protein [Roseofilum capinflatum]|uniref:CHAT domain-containing protein n=1 Tax=Roseofilum capinflatum BLCC-M114 TaxID=3022440 RepID=A0ABT7B6J5_9CYAN|nr:CHAT domain-containing protein [Roseofilum capinflatum]MDJ1174156.1 CHAT domain-containing protein [Roseofilum capinflatum BLCC-M114]